MQQAERREETGRVQGSSNTLQRCAPVTHPPARVHHLQFYHHPKWSIHTCSHQQIKPGAFVSAHRYLRGKLPNLTPLSSVKTQINHHTKQGQRPTYGHVVWCVLNLGIPFYWNCIWWEARVSVEKFRSSWALKNPAGHPQRNRPRKGPDLTPSPGLFPPGRCC